jgi:CHAD domain
MGTKRTAIRRRLAVGRAAHRPPWGGWKASHRSIVAPLAATVAASVAVGVGVALAKAGREQRSARQRRANRRFALARGEPLREGLQRIALGQVDLIIDVLGGGEEQTRKRGEQAVHETRKALKRLRALIRLLQDQLGEQAFALEDAALRDTARRLAAARDAEVMLSTLDQLLAREPRKLAKRKGMRRLHRQLLAEQQRARVDEVTRAQVLAELRGFRLRVLGWRLADHDGLVLIEPGLRRCYREGRRRYRDAARESGDATRAMHEWRKRVKDLRYAAEVLQRRRLARRADELSELLGEEHDLAVLAERVRSYSKRSRPKRERVGRATRKRLLKLIARRRRRLRRRALRRGKRLYRRSPKHFVARLRDA